MKPSLRELRLSTLRMCRPIVCQVEAIVKQLTGTMPTTNVSTIAGHRMISEQVEVPFYQLLIQVLLVAGTQFGMTISTFMRQVWPLMISLNASSRACKLLQNVLGDPIVRLRPLQNVPYQQALMRHSQILIKRLIKVICLLSILKPSRTMQARKWRQASKDWLLRKTAASKAWLVMLVQVMSWSLMWQSLVTVNKPSQQVGTTVSI